MRVLVLVKYTPDLVSDRAFAADGTVDRAAVDSNLSELDEYAVEQALQIAEKGSDVEVTYLTMGPADATGALRKALSMGGDKGIHVLDDSLHGSDYLSTSLVLAEAIKKAGFDLVVTGMASTDGNGGVISAMLAERLGVSQVTLAGEILSVDDSSVTIRRDGDLASMTITGSLPAVVSVTDQTGEARYPSFRGIMAAKNKPVETWSLADLGVDAELVGLSGAATSVESADRRPPRTAGEVVNDEGDGGIKAADFLVSNKLV
jgi:electron transfer flavoprotein beta subunit